MIPDNLEQLADLARDLHELLTRCPGLRLMATSRTVLGLQAERKYPVPALQLPPDPATAALDDIAASPAAALFVDRARAVRRDFALTAANVAAVTHICRRLEGLPLAIELAAARIRLLDPAALQERLCGSLDALGSGAVDAPERSRPRGPRSSGAWACWTTPSDLCWKVAAVFTDGWTLAAVAQAAGLGDDRALELTEALARHSLVQPYGAEPEPRSRMLETVREFVAERLDARADGKEIRQRHAAYYRSLAERARGPLRRGGHDEWAGRLEGEGSNLSAAVRWYLANDPVQLPGMLDALLPVVAFDDDFIAEARSWIEQLLPTVDSLDSEASAQVLLAAAVTARELDDPAARAAHDRLRSLLKTIRQPYLHAVSQVAMAITSGIAGDVDLALREAAGGLTELRDQDEPFWTAMALVTLGTIDTAVGRYDDALSHLREMDDLAERFSDARLVAGAQLQLGSLALAQGRLDDASALLAKGLDRNLAISNTRNVSVSLAAIAQLAFAEGDLERSTLLGGAAEGVRWRVGLRMIDAGRSPSNARAATLNTAFTSSSFTGISICSGLSGDATSCSYPEEYVARHGHDRDYITVAVNRNPSQAQFSEWHLESNAGHEPARSVAAYFFQGRSIRIPFAIRTGRGKVLSMNSRSVSLSGSRTTSIGSCLDIYPPPPGRSDLACRYTRNEFGLIARWLFSVARPEHDHPDAPSRPQPDLRHETRESRVRLRVLVAR